MAENTAQTLTEESIKRAAADFVRQGVDIRAKVRDLTLLGLQDHRFDRKGMQDVVRAVTEGVATGAENTSGNMRKAVGDALDGLDQALVKSAEAGAAALKQLASAGKGFSDNELKAALANLKKLEDDFIATVSHVADAASTQVQPQLREALGHLQSTGTATGKQLALTMNDFAHRFTVASIDATIAGLDAASEFGARFANLASGMLSGFAEALQKNAETKREVPPKAR